MLGGRVVLSRTKDRLKILNLGKASLRPGIPVKRSSPGFRWLPVERKS